MTTPQTTGAPRRASSHESAIRRIVAEIDAGLRHGYFEYALTCEVIGHGRRRLVLRAGKSYQFVIPENECEQFSSLPTGASDDGASIGRYGKS